MQARWLWLLVGAWLGLTSHLLAQWDPPSSYYNSATGTGSTLKSQLHNIIDNHTQRSYDQLRQDLQVTDEDPNNPANILLVYDRSSTNSAWDNADDWNREHTWPRSRGVNSSGPDNSDMHQIRPSDVQVNSNRGSLNFGGAFGAQSYGTVSDGGTVWYPGDADAGMIARQMFYMAVRYDGSDSATEDLEIGSQLGSLSRMIEWHYAAPADDFELKRNHLIYGYQNNRNPFIDRPEYVWSVFMNQNNDSRLSVGGSTPDTNGGSARTIDLGTVFVGSNVATSTSATINKTGSNGTYFEVTTTGDATSTLSGRHNNFETGSTGSRTFTVGLDGSTATAGTLSGSVIIDNLDVTTGGGAGRGANDNNDLIDLSLTVLNHSNASFSDATSLKQITHDFGTLVQGDVATPWLFDITNIAGPGSNAFTANLDIDQVTTTGDVTELFTTLAPTNISNRIVGGESRMFVAVANTSTTGALSATYTIDVSDQNIAGALSDTLTLTLLANVVAPANGNGDYDLDGDVDADDYVAWQSTFNSTTMLNADGNGNGIVDAADFVIWRDNTSSTVAAQFAVPEPGMGWPLVLGGILMLCVRRRR